MILVTIHDPKSINTLAEYADGFIVGLEHVSVRSIQTFSFEEYRQFYETVHSLNKSVYINATKLFMEEELPDARQMLDLVKSIGADGIYYADEGFYQLAKERQMEHLLVYQPETLVTNHMDVQYYLNQGIQSVSLAHELSLEEIQSIAKVENNIEILIHGTYSVLYSKRRLVTNYLEAHNITWDHPLIFDLIEQTRQDRMPIVEDENGTHIFTEAKQKSIHQFEELKKAGIRRFRIDSLFQDDQWTLDILKHYIEGSDVEDGSDHWYHQESVDRKEGSHE